MEKLESDNRDENWRSQLGKASRGNSGVEGDFPSCPPAPESRRPPSSSVGPKTSGSIDDAWTFDCNGNSIYQSSALKRRESESSALQPWCEPITPKDVVGRIGKLT
jgi:hypothetical protein